MSLHSLLPTISSCPPQFTVGQRHHHYTPNPFLTDIQLMQVQMSVQRDHKENVFTTDQTTGLWCCWVEFKIKRDIERELESLSFRQKSTCLPCMDFPRPWPNFQPCFSRSRCPMLSWYEEERKEIPQYSNNKKSFIHTKTHIQTITSTLGSQITVKTSSLSSMLRSSDTP